MKRVRLDLDLDWIEILLLPIISIAINCIEGIGPLNIVQPNIITLSKHGSSTIYCEQESM